MTSQGRQYPDGPLEPPAGARFNTFAGYPVQGRPPPHEDAHPAASITRWHWSDWPRLVRGQRVTAWDREWRVTEAWTDQAGNETYRLELAEVVDARIAAERRSARVLSPSAARL